VHRWALAFLVPGADTSVTNGIRPFREPMHVTPAIRRYVFATNIIFWSLVVLSAGTNSFDFGHPLTLVLPLLGAAIAAEALIVNRGGSSASFSVAAHIAAAILFGPLAAALVASVAVIVVDGLRLGPRPPVFLNAAIFGLAAWAAGWAFLLTGGTTGRLTSAEILPLIVLIAVRFLTNECLISVAISLSSGAGVLRVLRDGVRDLGGAAVGEGCLGVLVAFGYSSQDWMILPFLVPLLAALYTSQLNLERLRSETAAALDAFAGVIDEREANTARHSERVAEYVERFVEAIKLPDREAERLVKAARFHDLGKVAVDVSTLTREGRLGPDELRAIRSHPRLSARLLSRFHFAQEMAVYAELHHERYDGRGYYSVLQRDIPVEAHVLIVADSFDAMTSPRAYRAALSTAEAVHELREKAGSQFHPLVAHAFAAMIERRDVLEAIGPSQLDALRAEFSRIPALQLPPLGVLLNPRLVTVSAAAALLIAVGVPGVPRAVIFGTAGLAIVSATTAIYRTAVDRRRRQRAMAVASDTRSAAAALTAGGIPGEAVWLRIGADGEHYMPHAEADNGVEPSDVEALCQRALRVGFEVETGVLESGRYYALTPVEDGPRLAVCSARTLSLFEQQLLVELHAATAPAERETNEPVLALVGGNERRGATTETPGVIVVDLGIFEDVRTVAGQLTAERVVADAATRLRNLLRTGDLLELIGEDTLGIIVAVSDERHLGVICDRMRAALQDVPVPTRAEPIDPTFNASADPAKSGDQALIGVLSRATNRGRATG
jgi:HD-GYP domain-containing protein (c-di-GMP phosphodiesterase class II)/GGDEF domain-containing protein